MRYVSETIMRYIYMFVLVSCDFCANDDYLQLYMFDFILLFNVTNASLICY
jgi:hypothetical protein